MSHLVSSPPAPTRAARQPHLHRLFVRPTCASRSPRVLPTGASARYQPQPELQPHVVAAQSLPLRAAGAVPRDAETGLSLLLFVLAAVMTFLLFLIISSFSACSVLQKMEIAANKLAKTVAEEVPGTISSLKLSFMEINDLTSRLKNLRKLLAINPFGKETRSRASPQTR